MEWEDTADEWAERRVNAKDCREGRMIEIVYIGFDNSDTLINLNNARHIRLNTQSIYHSAICPNSSREARFHHIYLCLYVVASSSSNVGL